MKFIILLSLCALLVSCEDKETKETVDNSSQEPEMVIVSCRCDVLDKPTISNHEVIGRGIHQEEAHNQAQELCKKDGSDTKIHNCRNKKTNKPLPAKKPKAG